MIVVLAVLAGFGNFVAVEASVTPGDAARTADDIAASSTLFRLGIVSLLVVVALDVLVAGALYRVFRAVDDSLSRLQAWLRLAYAGVLAVAVAHLLTAVRLISDGGSGLSVDQANVQALVEIEAFGDVWDAGLLLFGLHLLLLGWLTHRSGVAPRLLGLLLAVAGAGYIFDTVAAVLIGDGAPSVSSFTFIGEFVLAVWLLITGGRALKSVTTAEAT